MTYKTRIGILIGFIALFLITTPIVVTYTAGYRWNVKKNRLEKVGIIYVRSKPSNADLYLDGKPRPEKTPARLRNLLPDTYKLTVGKSGYLSWTKILPVESALTTFVEGVVLWKDSAPEKVAASPSAALTTEEVAGLNRSNPLKANADNLTFESDGFEIWVESQTNGHETITRLSNEITAILPYATDTGWILYETATEIHAIERDGRDVRNDVLLASGGNLDGLAVSSDGKTLYYFDNAGGTRALFKRALQ